MNSTLGHVDRASVVTLEQAALELVEVGRYLGQQGLVPATSGNFSRRLNPHAVAVTATGLDKGFLSVEHILESPLDGPKPPRSSFETELHRELYRRNPDIQSVLHVHSVASTLLSQRYAAAGELRIVGYELQKALFGILDQHVEAVLPIVENDQDIDRLAQTVTRRLADTQGTVVGYLVEGHGLYTWGRSVEDARRHVIGVEFLLNCELEKLRWGRPS
ncbi:methylthioribulose 1-phosphate dehydratase [Pararobbsia silviterrae]|uniref:Methylthioribulose-1-phosphate dehydratase n=1 Tax=Pararobbsia silviterrae TaxID=1792498 RepID=A0A494XNI0_9BURK|nr:methylthioribulose 1-phosphate dehydratase [Pararobbsia silviterrae]RKP49634.1 methylthioribulose 1-phosphate dehydratase [Pararobbsia silviterrae]